MASSLDDKTCRSLLQAVSHCSSHHDANDVEAGFAFDLSEDEADADVSIETFGNEGGPSDMKGEPRPKRRSSKRKQGQTQLEPTMSSGSRDQPHPSSAASSAGPSQERVLATRPDGCKLLLLNHKNLQFGSCLYEVRCSWPSGITTPVGKISYVSKKGGRGVGVLKASCSIHRSCQCMLSNTPGDAAGEGSKINKLVEWLSSSLDISQARHADLSSEIRTSFGINVRV